MPVYCVLESRFTVNKLTFSSKSPFFPGGLSPYVSYKCKNILGLFPWDIEMTVEESLSTTRTGSPSSS